MAAVDANPSTVDETAAAQMRRLRWRARRGLLENDLMLARFLDRHGDALTPGQRDTLARLLLVPDPELLEILLGRQPAADPEAREMVSFIQTL